MPYTETHKGSKRVKLLWGKTVELNPSEILRKFEVKPVDPANPRKLGDGAWVCTGAIHEGELVDLCDLPTLLVNLVPDEVLSQIAKLEVNQETFIKHFIVYFYDDFAALRKVYHKTGAGYITSGNLPRHKRNLLRNIRPVHAVPPGVSPPEVIRSFEAEVRKLERCEVTMNVKGHVLRSGGGIGCICGDMPQSNLFAGVKGPTAYKSCRKCLVDKTDQKSYELRFRDKRTHAKQAAFRAAINSAPIQTLKEDLCTLFGVCTPSTDVYFSRNILDKQRQLPHDPFHCDIIGNTAALLAIFLQSLTPTARSELCTRICNWKVPPTWASIPKPVLASSKTKVKMGGQRVKELIVVLHMVCVGWLQPKHFTASRKAALTYRFGDLFIQKVLETLALQAASNQVVFGESHSISNSNGDALTSLLRNTRRAVVEVWHEIGDMNVNKPNQHVGTEHHGEVHEDFGGCLNATCAHFECKHGALRRSMHNGKNLELSMLDYENVYEAIMLCGVSKSHSDACCKDGVGEWIQKDPVFQKVLAQWTSAKTYADSNDGGSGSVPGIVKTGKYIGSSVLSTNIIVESWQYAAGRFGSAMKDHGNLRTLSDASWSVVQLFTYFELGGRQAYQSKVGVSEFYMCDNDIMLQVLGCLLLDVGGHKHYWSRVQEFKKTDRTAWGLYAVLEPSGRPFYVPARVISRPLYVIHCCDEHCRVQIGEAGLVGQHNTQNTRYMLNPFFVK
jgi:hypothetical protein